MKRIKMELIIEQAEDGLWGRVNYKDNLVSDFGNSVTELEEKIKGVLFDFEDVKPEDVEFDHLYDVYALFLKFDYLKISKVAERAGMNPGLLRQYASGVKHPSASQGKRIETTLHQLADELKDAFVFAE
ncbi:hypothetical protein [Daejeonella oryzae]|uniref:hypothetical protein n=1 Tax=Daejeonella oryzae TaxID=1122943 RepID=UPI00047BD1A8|nr:hypothetical protein [Daejeonella oryzae]